MNSGSPQVIYVNEFAMIKFEQPAAPNFLVTNQKPTRSLPSGSYLRRWSMQLNSSKARRTSDARASFMRFVSVILFFMCAAFQDRL